MRGSASRIERKNISASRLKTSRNKIFTEEMGCGDGLQRSCIYISEFWVLRNGRPRVRRNDLIAGDYTTLHSSRFTD